MKPIVDRELCIGCGLCEQTAPEVFRLGEDGIAYVIDESPPQESYDDVMACVELCPTQAISVEPE